jgi:hypothetical protein
MIEVFEQTVVTSVSWVRLKATVGSLLLAQNPTPVTVIVFAV